MFYMLNLVFDGGDSTETNNGRFQEFIESQPTLQQSQAWYQQSATSPTPPDPNNPDHWSFKQDDNRGPLVPAVGDQVWVRVSGLNATGFCARMTTIIARNARKASKGNNGKAFQQRASPFALNGTQQSCVLYDTMVPTFQGPVNGSWVQQLGAVTFTTPPPSPPPQNFHDSYSMIVAFTTGAGQPGEGPLSTLRTYAHDPEMEIDYDG
jgi:hypothetical protein